MDTHEQRILALFSPERPELHRRWLTLLSVAKSVLVVTFYVGTLLLLFVIAAEGTAAAPGL